MSSGGVTDPGKLAARTLACAFCGVSFVARKSQIDAGYAVCCSHKCSWQHRGAARLNAPEIQQRAIENRLASIAVNGTKHGRGEAHWAWKGGAEAAYERGKPRKTAYTRAYRKANPEWTREQAHKRRDRKASERRLPRGTVKRIGELQRWKCAICKCALAKDYHLDHIQPIAKGGKHEATNLQLLCPPCNVRKAAKDPIDYMQSRGFLL